MVDTVSGRGRGVLEGAFTLIDFLPDTFPPHQVRDLAELTGVPRASVYRLLTQLRELGVVEFIGQRYVLGRTMLNLARRIEPTTGLRHVAAPVMAALRRQTGGTVALVSETENSTTILDSVPGRDSLPVAIFEGRLLPLHAAGSLVIEPAAAPGRVDRVHRSAVDSEDVIEGLSCFAVAIPLPGGGFAALQLSTVASDAAFGYAPETFAAAASIRDALPA